MAEPVVVTIPHKLTKEEATRRLKHGFGNVRSTIGEKFVVLTDDWTGDHLDFRASLLGQTTTGTVDVGEHSVRLEIQLPWMLAMLATKAKPIGQKQGSAKVEEAKQVPHHIDLSLQDISTISASAVPASTTSPTCLPMSA